MSDKKFSIAIATLGLTLISSLCVLAAQTPEVPLNLRRLWGLIEYIRGDYPEAVEKTGNTIIDTTEYDEMLEFSDSALHYFHDLSQKVSFKDATKIQKELENLSQAVKNKSPYSQILNSTELLKNYLLQSFPSQAFPQEKLSFSDGQKNYVGVCGQCHGQEGLGDGILAASLAEPKPRNFHEAGAMELGSPFKFFNTLETGIAGTTMQSYSGVFAPNQMWNLSFYLMGLRFYDTLGLGFGQDPASGEVKENYAKELKWLNGFDLDLAQLAQLSDEQLRLWIKEQQTASCKVEAGKTQCEEGAGADIGIYLALIRLVLPYLIEPKPDEKSHSAAAHTFETLSKSLAFAMHNLEVARNYFQSDNYSLAEQKILDAYLGGFEKLETTLGLQRRDLVLAIEQDFLDLRAYAKKADKEHFEPRMRGILERLRSCEDLLIQAFDKDTSSPIGDFTGAFIIIVREGIEAFLIIAALLALLGNAGLNREKKWVHLGWICAIAAGIVSYFIFERILRLSGAARETMEAITTGIAVILLFYTGFWLLSQGEHRKWQKFIRGSTGEALSSKSIATLFALSFIAVYREAVETVVFYSAMLVVSDTPFYVFLGFGVGCILLLALCWAMIRFNVRLPLPQFFKGTSALLVLISIILAGKSVHELIEAGFLEATPVPFLPVIELIGVYPSVETLAAQAGLIVLGIILLTNAHLRSKNDSISASISS